MSFTDMHAHEIRSNKCFEEKGHRHGVGVLESQVGVKKTWTTRQRRARSVPTNL